MWGKFVNIIRSLFRRGGGKEREAGFVAQAQEDLTKKENVPIELRLRGEDIVVLNDFVSAWRRDNRIEDMASVLVTRFQEVVDGEGFNHDDVYTISLSEREILSFGQMLFALIPIPEDSRSTKFGYPKDKASLINKSIQNLVNAYKESTGFVSKLRSTYLLALRGIGDVEYSDEDDTDEDNLE